MNGMQGMQGLGGLLMDEYFESTMEDFSRAASDIACYNDNPSSVFSTLRSVAKKLLKDNVRYRTLDTTNPKVMERLIGFEGVLDFLMLLGFESDAMGMKLICQQKPSPKVVSSAIKVLNSYQQRFRMTDRGDGNRPQQNQNGKAPYLAKNGNIDNLEEPMSPDMVSPGGDFEPAAIGNDNNNNDILTLEQIVIWGTNEYMQDPNNETMETLIMTHHMFTDSVTLLKQLRKRFFVPIPAELLEADDGDLHGKEERIRSFQTEVQKRIQLKVIKALRDWMKHYWAEDFEGNDEIQKVEKEYLRLKQVDWDRELEHKMNILAQYDDVVIPESEKSTTMLLTKSTAEELADQLTLLDYRLFSSIEPREGVHQRWKDVDNKRMAPNILSLIQQFNNFTIFIQIQILKESSLKKRALALKRIIKMGEHFRQTRNYNSLCAVFSALNSAPIHRLKLCWQRVPEKNPMAFQQWSQIFSRDGSHRNLRQLLRRAGGNPCIPHIGLFLQDLVFIDEGNQGKYQLQNFKNTEILNFNKCVRIADRIKNLQLFQKHKYSEQIKEKKVLQKVLLLEFEKLKDVTEEQIWDMSTEIKKQDAKDANKGLFGVGGH